MTKYIEWLKNEVLNQNLINKDGYIYAGDLTRLLRQLDEPETVEETALLLENVLKENKRLGKLLEEKHEEWLELMDEINNQEVLSDKWIDNNSVYASSDGITEEYVCVDDLQNLLVPKQEITEEQVTEYLRERSMTAVDSTLVHRENLVSKIVTEIPTIPEFVAEFLEGREGYALYELFDDEWLYDNHDELARWLYDNDEKTNRERELNLVLAQRVGYEVETEQRYYVMNNDDRMMLVRMMDGKTITEADPFKLEDMYEAEKKAHRLTEKEIKDYDERYFAFAKPVEEVEG